ncbi:hypothetical protein HZB89_00420 [archaeon]|nr:hypothetical protein [archaeon]
MPREVISSFEKFSQAFPAVCSGGNAGALKLYFESGAIISVDSEARQKGSLVCYYPTFMRLQMQLQQAEKNLSLFQAKEKEWKKQFSSAKMHNLVGEVKKFTDVIYWKHVGKSLTDKDYRQAYDKVKIPTKLVSNPRYRAMLEMFVDNPYYRKQLTETVSNSIIYEKDPRVAKNADAVINFRIEASQKQLLDLEGKINALKQDKKMLESMKKIIKM